MLTTELLFEILGLIVVGAPALLLIVLGVSSLIQSPLSETAIGRLVPATIFTGLCAAVAILAMMLTLDIVNVPIELGSWVSIPHYHFSVKFVFDRLSVPFVILAFVLTGTIGAFANRYMHREPGFNRFFVLFALFVVGIVMTSLAGTIETLFAGWEMVGLSSAMLVAFFHERPAPVRNGLRVWSVYRVSDAALLMASVVLHHLTGEGDFSKFLGGGPWPLGEAQLTQQQALLVGLLLLLAAAGKSALVPFSGWLPRAMEGPTPSSAVFYGALSVHLGAFLLLRVSPIIDESLPLQIIITTVGVTTAILAALAGRAQSDIKSSLSFASLTQVGIIVAEIGLGLRYLALIHILGHGCLRTLQFVRAPTILLDVRTMENAIGSRLPHPKVGPERIATGLGPWLYRLAIERGYLDACLTYFVVTPFLKVFRWCDAAERRWTDFLARGHSRESDDIEPAVTPFEDLL
ncbi:MAG TPA: proton-conducting transporter membrane subunit [Pirellulaceae bacterium]|nr:proton-conducting transporter membrane subunit [Pirellulaceae bacterium]